MIVDQDKGVYVNSRKWIAPAPFFLQERLIVSGGYMRWRKDWRQGYG